MGVKITKALNLIIPIEMEDGKSIFVHSTPIAREIFEAHFMVLSKTFSRIYAEGLSVLSGPRVAYLMLKQVATEMGLWEAVESGVWNEIVRLSMVAVPSEKGYEQYPLDVVLKRKIIDGEARSEVEGALVFFTLTSLIQKKSQVAGTLETVTGLWELGVTALSFTDFLTSLPTSTEAANSGEMATTLSAQPLIISPAQALENTSPIVV